MNRLRNKRALITGGTTGIGLETARAFLAEGARVAITGRNPATLEAARKDLQDRGIDISEVFHSEGEVYAGADEPYLFGQRRVTGPDPKHGSYRSFASFHDPDGNGWLLQEITTRLPGRIDSAATTFASVKDLADAMRRAEAAHGEHEKRLGTRDENWPAWYAQYMAREQSGEKLPE